MPRYIDEKDVYALVEPTGTARLHCSQIDALPRADVVPKSEYDSVLSAVDNSTKEFLKLHDTYQEQNAEIERLNQIINSYALQYGTVTVKHAVIDKAKDAVAREIFAEILSNFCGAYTYTGYTIERYIAKLKKKYTEN